MIGASSEPVPSGRENLPADLRALATIAYITGWRIASELAPLTWADVDFANGFIRVEDSKNGEARMFPFTPELREVLQEQRAQTDELEREAGKITASVFWRVKGPGVPTDGTPVGSFRKAWGSACRAAGVPGKIPHYFRRTAVRNLEMAGVPRSAAMAAVGHKTEAIYRRYAIVDAAMLRAAADKLGAFHDARRAAPRKVVPIRKAE